MANFELQRQYSENSYPPPPDLSDVSSDSGTTFPFIAHVTSNRSNISNQTNSKPNIPSRASSFVGALKRITDFEIDPFGARDTFRSVTEPYEVPKVGKNMQHMSLEERQQTLNDRRSKAQQDWEKKRLDAYDINNGGDGLSDGEVDELHKTEGYNELEQRKPPSFWRILAKQCVNVVPLVLWFECVMYFALQQPIAAVGYVTTGLLVVLVAAFGEYKSARSCLDESNSKKQPVRVKRNGVEIQVEPRELVRGDLIYLSAGDYVPADCRLLDGNDVACIEMTLTGEPDDIPKHSRDADDSTENGLSMFPPDILLSSTVMSSGKATAYVFSIGMHTKVGQMATEIVKDKTGLFPLQTSINRFGSVCTIFAVCFSVAISLVLAVTNYQEPLSQERTELTRVMSCILVGVQGGMAALPIAILPVTLFLLNKAMFSLKKQHCQVKKPSSVDVLGCVTVICSDKTGTISSGKMTAVKLATFDSSALGKEFEFYPFRGFHPNGGLWKSDSLSVDDKEAIDSKFDVKSERTNYEEVIENRTIDIASTSNSTHTDAIIPRAALLAFTLNSYNTKLTSEEKEDCSKQATTVWDIQGNMSEGALVVAGKKAGFDTENVDKLYPRVYEVEFTSSRKMALSIHKLQNPGTPDACFGQISLPNQSYIAIVKGAPDRVCPNITSAPVSGKGEFATIEPASDKRFLCDRVTAQTKYFNVDGLRALLCCGRALSEEDFRVLEEVGSAQGVFDKVLSSKQMSTGESSVFVMGLCGISDPPKFGVKQAVDQNVIMTNAALESVDAFQSFRSGASGSRPEESLDERMARCGAFRFPVRSLVRSYRQVVMITGDHIDTARYIAAATNIYQQSSGCPEVRPASDLRDDNGNLKSDTDIDFMVSKTCVWARAQPVDKIVIVEAFQRLGHVVAMTGDGVNDTAALHGSDIGVAMGITGTDVAQAEADMILLDDNFTTIVRAIEEGRRIFMLISQFAVYNMCLNFPLIAIVVLCVIFYMPAPFWNISTLVTSVCTNYLASLSFSFGKRYHVEMDEPPRRKNSGFLMRVAIYAMILPWVIVASGLLFTSYYMSLKTFLGTVDRAQIIGSGHASQNGIFSDFWMYDDGMSDLCSFGWTENADGTLKQDIRPYHCKCNWYHVFNWVDSTSSFDHWGQARYNEHDRENWGRKTADSGGSGFPNPTIPDMSYRAGLVQDNFLQSDFEGNLLRTAPHPDNKDINIWVWKDPKQARNLPLGHCADYGVMQARSILFFVTLIAMTFNLLVVASGRDFLFKWATLKRLGLHIATLCIAVGLGLLAMFVPVINVTFCNLASLRSNAVLLMFMFLVFLCLFDEALKMLFYRPRIDARSAKRRKIAKLAGKGLMNPWVSKRQVGQASTVTNVIRANEQEQSTFSKEV